MNQGRKIIHVDQDCFYAAVEVRDNPSLRGKPVAVGGQAENRGVLTTASYEARKFGVHSAMSTSRALKLCPELTLIPVHFDKYRAESRKIRKIFQNFTHKVEPLSLDEAYLDVTDCTDFNGSATLIAQEIRHQIFEETKLTASAGIAPNKFLAKIASDWNKPNGQFTISPELVDEFVEKLVVEKIPGVGKVTSQKMYKLGIKTCADLQGWSIGELNHHFGSWGIRLFDLCRGQDDREVSIDRVRKSLSVENTYNKDLINIQDSLDQVPNLYNELIKRLEKTQTKDQIRSLVVKVKFSDFTQTTLEQSTTLKPSIEIYKKMVQNAVKRRGRPVRLLGVGVRFVSKTFSPKTLQLNFFENC